MSHTTLHRGALLALLAMASATYAQAPVTEGAPAKAVEASAKAPDATEAQGKVAYYGHKFDGRKTASGERFNSGSLTMAHKTLPFGTLVRVTHLNNHRSVVVRVNDRGPSTTDRIGDLSLAAARKLHMTSSGVSEVKFETVGLGRKV